MDFLDAITKALTGRRSEKQTRNALLNTTKTITDRGTWAQVAQESGISERTLRRLRAGGKPSQPTLDKLAALSRRTDVREAAMRPGARRKLARGLRNGARIKVKAQQGPKGYGQDDYRRARTVDFMVPPDTLEGIANAYQSGDDAALQQLVADAVADYGWSSWEPVGGWDIGAVDELEVSGLLDAPENDDEE